MTQPAEPPDLAQRDAAAKEDAAARYVMHRDKDYLTWLASDTATGLAGALATFAIPLIAIAITDSPVQAGIIGAASMLVRLVATLFGGVMADRHDRLLLMVLGALGGLVVAAAFALLDLSGGLTFVALFAISVLLSLRAGLFDVAGESAIKQVVPAQAMGRAQAANQARDAAVNLAGGPAGGALLAGGAWLVALGAAGAHVAALVTAVILRRRSGAMAPTPEKEPARSAGTPLLAEAGQGIRWLMLRPDLRGVLLVGTIINLGFNLGVTTLIYWLRLEGYSPQAIGWLTAILSGAMLAAAAASPLLVTRVRAGLLALFGLLLCTAGIIMVGLAQSFAAIATILALSVLLVPALNAALMGYMVTATPSQLLGRVNSAGRVLGMGAMPLAPLLAGFGLAWFGRPGTLLLAGAICSVAVVLVLLTPSIRALPAEPTWLDHAARFGDEPLQPT